MIDSTSSPDSSSRTSSYSPAYPQVQVQRNAVQSDTLSTDQAEQVNQALTRDPEIRSEVVARGRELAADPSYPSPAIISNVAAQIVNSPDLSEDGS